MIAFAAAISDPEAYQRFAAPGIQLASEPDSEVYAFASVGSVCRSYNLLLDAAARRADLEALVIVSQDAQLADAGTCRTIRSVLADGDVGVVGCMGAKDVRGVAWWEGAVSCGPVTHRYYEHGEGEFEGFPWAEATVPPGEVDAVDGCLLVLSPWVVRNVRFDESLTPAHGYSVDFCLRVRESGRKVVTTGLGVVRHCSLELIGDPELWVEGHIRAAEKWDGRLLGTEPREGDWKMRARRAEAERDAARTVAYSNALRMDARVVPLEQQYETLTNSFSWRVTAPLRALNQVRRRRLVRERAPDRRLGNHRLLARDARPMPQTREALRD